MRATPPSRRRAAQLTARRRAFSMVESLLAVAVAAIAGAALLNSLAAGVRTASDAAASLVARGLAQQMMEEIAGVRFPDAQSSRRTGSHRASFESIDDYGGWSAQPPVDRQGIPLGLLSRASRELLGRLRRSVVVERVEPSGTNGWSVVTRHTDYRRVTVTVTLAMDRAGERTLAFLTRIFSYVPPAP
ncbi:MAG: hypothetical protein KY476_08250 [Planctomycetes bacterium]|nr:hypothetical protein [Planctomycetota bacterium]